MEEKEFAEKISFYNWLLVQKIDFKYKKVPKARREVLESMETWTWELTKNDLGYLIQVFKDMGESFSDDHDANMSFLLHQSKLEKLNGTNKNFIKLLEKKGLSLEMTKQDWESIRYVLYEGVDEEDRQRK